MVLYIHNDKLSKPLYTYGIILKLAHHKVKEKQQQQQQTDRERHRETQISKQRRPSFYRRELLNTHGKNYSLEGKLPTVYIT